MGSYLTQLLKVLSGLVDARFLALAMPSFAYLYTDPAIAGTIMYSVAAMVCFAAVSHLLRKIFFPYVDMKEFSDTALRDPKAAAIVFASVTLLLCTILLTTVMWLKG